MILLLGGIAYARAISDERAQRFKTVLYTLLTLIVVSGFYNYFTYSGPRHTSAYQMWFGIKFLLVLHVLATAILWATSSYSPIKSNRRLLSMAISGFVIVFISNYLRSLTQRGL